MHARPLGVGAQLHAPDGLEQGMPPSAGIGGRPIPVSSAADARGVGEQGLPIAPGPRPVARVRQRFGSASPSWAGEIFQQVRFGEDASSAGDAAVAPEEVQGNVRFGTTMCNLLAGGGFSIGNLGTAEGQWRQRNLPYLRRKRGSHRMWSAGTRGSIWTIGAGGRGNRRGGSNSVERMGRIRLRRYETHNIGTGSAMPPRPRWLLRYGARRRQSRLRHGRQQERSLLAGFGSLRRPELLLPCACTAAVCLLLLLETHERGEFFTRFHGFVLCFFEHLNLNPTHAPKPHANTPTPSVLPELLWWLLSSK